MVRADALLDDACLDHVSTEDQLRESVPAVADLANEAFGFDPDNAADAETADQILPIGVFAQEVRRAPHAPRHATQRSEIHLGFGHVLRGPDTGLTRPKGPIGPRAGAGRRDDAGSVRDDTRRACGGAVGAEPRMATMAPTPRPACGERGVARIDDPSYA